MIFAAADVSEQISTASKEASGTGNMKFMLNGAITLGTMDGANVEIVEEVGKDNAVIFGLSAQEVIEFEHNHEYDPKTVYNSDMRVKKVVDQLVDGTYTQEDPNLFRELYDSLLNEDQYFILKDFAAYAEAQKKIDEKYRDQHEWVRSSLINIAKSGKFSSDRTIQEYVDDLWHLDKVKIK
jgi:starch phosphorylase